MGLTPQLQQRRDLLRMTRAEVQAVIERLVLENPALEIIMPDPDDRLIDEQFPEGEPAPDVCVEEEDGEYQIYFLGDDSPRLRISDRCQRMLARPETPAEEREDIKKNVRSAVHLLRDIEYRRQSIYRVVEHIVRNQTDFLAEGLASIKPESLKAVARVTGMSDSEVSLVVAGKYLQTRHGVFELRRFITEG